MSALHALAAAFVGTDPVEAARCLEGAAPRDAVAVLAESPARDAARALEAMAPALAAECLEAWPTGPGLAGLLDALSDAALLALLRRLDQPARVSSTLGDRRRSRLETLGSYPAESVGRLADLQPLVLPPTRMAAEARDHLRSRNVADPGAVYLVGEDGGLDGVVPLARLAAAVGDEVLRDLAEPAPHRLSPWVPAASMVAHPGWAWSRELPVVDEEAGFVGRLRLDAVERAGMDQRAAAPGVSTTIALGELYWYMAASLFGAAAHPPAAGSEGEGDDGR